MSTLREIACRANLDLAETGLVVETFGNLSVVDRAAGVFAIKPSGVPYAQLTPDKIVIVSLVTGTVVEGTLRPSSDTPTHLELYRAFNCGAIVHTHSEYATMFAQARTPIGCMGTTHADYFRGDIPVTRPMTEAEISEGYEKNTGLVIAETFKTHATVTGRSARGAGREPRPVHVGPRCRARHRAGARVRAGRATRLSRAGDGAGCAAAGSIPDR